MPPSPPDASEERKSHINAPSFGASLCWSRSMRIDIGAYLSTKEGIVCVLIAGQVGKTLAV